MVIKRKLVNEETHAEHAKKANLSKPCTAHDLTYGGKCFNCGYDPKNTAQSMPKLKSLVPEEMLVSREAPVSYKLMYADNGLDMEKGMELAKSLASKFQGVTCEPKNDLVMIMSCPDRASNVQSYLKQTGYKIAKPTLSDEVQAPQQVYCTHCGGNFDVDKVKGLNCPDCGGTFKIKKEQVMTETFTKQHFVRIAKLLSNIPDYYTKHDLTVEFIKMFQADNPRFDAEKFWSAVGLRTNAGLLYKDSGRQPFNPKYSKTEDIENTNMISPGQKFNIKDMDLEKGKFSGKPWQKDNRL